ncbi:hypothetical protein J1TS5_03930 [Paenibacillus macerans]|uniref:DUF4238 domain-containing protein n=1 Tax=Paenibacillus macerans TaxID=44252 RepID=UPI001B15D677|nr:DUF4238 domain-containing protein [Paenibacillus macerans]GIP08223.1 hypothetical protein J1TS5_03930 [Paenibacillus macerans]
MEKVSHHYVPQFYLKNFSSNRKSIGLYNIKNNLYIKDASIKKQACKDYLYGKDDELENLFMDLESYAAIILKNIITNRKLPRQNSEEYDTLLFFLLLSEARNLKNADSTDNFVDVTSKLMLSMDKKYRIPKDFINKVNISLEIPNLYSIRTVAENFRILYDLKCTLLINKSDRQFITSDNPLVRYNLMYVVRKYKLRGYGLGSMGIQLFFPISPEICICLFDSNLYDFRHDNQGNIVISKGKHIDELNKLFYLNSYRSIFFHNSIQSQYIRRIADKNIHTTGEVKEEITILPSQREDRDGYIIWLSPRQVNVKINLPMFNINRNFIKMPLPGHMAGPIRPYARAFLRDDDQDFD